MTRGRLLVIGVVFVAAGIGGIAASTRSAERDNDSSRLLPITNRCDVPLEFTVTAPDGTQQRFEILSDGLGTLTVRRGAEITARSSAGENTFSVPTDGGVLLPEWVVEGSGCSSLTPDWA